MKKIKSRNKRKASKRHSVKVSEKAKVKKIKIKRLPARVLSKYKAALLKEREKIGGGISHITQEALKTSQRDAAGDLSGYSFHMADMASDNYEREFSLGRATEEQGFLYAIDEALKRIEDGTYGSCLQCSKSISKKRLDAVPHAELCIECQTNNEKK